jgi:hypothetical protein
MTQRIQDSPDGHDRGDGRDHDDTREQQPDPREREHLTPWQIVASTLAAAFGVQSSRNRERDFTRGRAIHFIIAGIVFTVLFVLAVVLVVNLVLSSAG